MTKKILTITVMAICLMACRNDSPKNKLVVSGEIKNLPDQKIYLEQLYFSQREPEILDTTDMKNGRFTVSTIATEEGMFRLRMEKNERGFIFINDRPAISFTADIKDLSLNGPDFHTPANDLLKNLVSNLQARGKVLNASVEKLQAMQQSDSNFAAESANHDKLSADYKNYLVHFIDTASDPVVAIFALGYTKGVDPDELKTIVPGLQKRFPSHKAVAEMVEQYTQYMAKRNEPKTPASSRPQAGDMAPDFAMPDTSGKTVSLSSFKGKYLLVDFWASWCGPCRGENPNVVAAYNRFKDKNFTILGVSLDKDKQAWVNAINQDGLTWTHVSDLKFWNSAAVPLYGFDGIPYNVLIDPTGKIIASELRGEDLPVTLSKFLK